MAQSWETIRKNQEYFKKTTGRNQWKHDKLSASTIRFFDANNNEINASNQFIWKHDSQNIIAFDPHEYSIMVQRLL